MSASATRGEPQSPLARALALLVLFAVLAAVSPTIALVLAVGIRAGAARCDGCSWRDCF